MKTLNELRQGEVLNNSTLKRLQDLCPVNLNVVMSDESFCVVVTQDCDIVHVKMARIPENFILKMMVNFLNLLYITDYM